jgi:hypothetical protein
LLVTPRIKNSSASSLLFCGNSAIGGVFEQECCVNGPGAGTGRLTQYYIL